MSRAIPVFWIIILNLLLLGAMMEANHLLAPWGVSIHLEAVFVLFAGLYLRVLHGAFLVVILGGSLDATHSPGFGPMLLLLLGLWTLVVYLRTRIRRQIRFQVRMTALGTQLLFLLAATVLFARPAWAMGAFWQRFALDSLLSLTVVALFAVPWGNLQIRLLQSFNWDITSERSDG